MDSEIIRAVKKHKLAKHHAKVNESSEVTPIVQARNGAQVSDTKIALWKRIEIRFVRKE